MSGAPPLRALSVEAFLDALASKSPVPGGGALAALALAQGTALASMVVAYSIGKPSLAAFDSWLRETEAELAAERARALALMDDDAAAYAQLRDALALARDDPQRRDRVRAAARRAAEPPREVVERAVALLRRLEALVPRTSPPLRSDLEVAGAMALAAAESGARNVRANLPLLGPDDGERDTVDRAAGDLLAAAREAKTALDAAVEVAEAARR